VDNMYGNSDGGGRGTRGQYMNSKFNKYDPTFGKRDLSAANGRVLGKLTGGNINSSYLNTSVDTSNSKANGLKANNSSNKLKTIKKMNNKNNVSVVNDKGKSKLESGSKKQDISVNSIKLKNSNIRNESTNINEQIKNQKTIGGDKKELGDLKGLKTVSKKKIETSVKL
jgi:hypothetical protein